MDSAKRWKYGDFLKVNASVYGPSSQRQNWNYATTYKIHPKGWIVSENVKAAQSGLIRHELNPFWLDSVSGKKKNRHLIQENHALFFCTKICSERILFSDSCLISLCALTFTPSYSHPQIQFWRSQTRLISIIHMVFKRSSRRNHKWNSGFEIVL